jgi:hypothetical protein
MISSFVLLKMRHPSDIRYRENQTIYFMLNYFIFLKIVPLWDNVEICGTPRQATDGNTIRRMRFACRIPKTTDAPSECVILIVFPQQQWLRERVSMLRYKYTACLVHDSMNNIWVFLTVDSTANDIYPQNNSLTQFYFWWSVYIVLILLHQSDVWSIRFDVVYVSVQMEVCYVCVMLFAVTLSIAANGNTVTAHDHIT